MPKHFCSTTTLYKIAEASATQRGTWYVKFLGAELILYGISFFVRDPEVLRWAESEPREGPLRHYYKT